jgi:hypothetical protein
VSASKRESTAYAESHKAAAPTRVGPRHHWLVLTESGDAESIKEIARNQGVDDRYASRMANPLPGEDLDGY